MVIAPSQQQPSNMRGLEGTGLPSQLGDGAGAHGRGAGSAGHYHVDGDRRQVKCRSARCEGATPILTSAEQHRRPRGKTARRSGRRASIWCIARHARRYSFRAFTDGPRQDTRALVGRQGCAHELHQPVHAPERASRVAVEDARRGPCSRVRPASGALIRLLATASGAKSCKPY
jgi:hypothetical protein